jgi:long-chain acyl-CoA synthetase
MGYLKRLLLVLVLPPSEYPHLAKDYWSVGVAAGYTEVAIVDADNPEKERASGEMGEIALRGPSITKGYWNMPEATAAVSGMMAGS